MNRYSFGYHYGVREGQNIDYRMLRDIRIPVPPIEEQLQIASFLDSIDARMKEIELLEQYKAAISSDIVTGQIDVRGIEVPEYETVEDTDISENSEEDTEGEEYEE